MPDVRPRMRYYRISDPVSYHEHELFLWYHTIQIKASGHLSSSGHIISLSMVDYGFFAVSQLRIVCCCYRFVCSDGLMESSFSSNKLATIWLDGFGVIQRTRNTFLRGTHHTRKGKFAIFKASIDNSDSLLRCYNVSFSFSSRCFVR